ATGREELLEVGVGAFHAPGARPCGELDGVDVAQRHDRRASRAVAVVVDLGDVAGADDRDAQRGFAHEDVSTCSLPGFWTRSLAAVSGLRESSRRIVGRA